MPSASIEARAAALNVPLLKPEDPTDRHDVRRVQKANQKRVVNAEQRLQQALVVKGSAPAGDSTVCVAADPPTPPLCDVRPLDSPDGLGDDTPVESLETLVCPADPVECDDANQPPCWGGQLRGTAECCKPGFQPRGARFKDKFCPSCLGRLEVASNRVWMLTPKLQKVLKNCKGHGFWSVGPTQFRVINNTINAGPALVIFRSPPVPVGDVASETWVPWTQDAWVRLHVSKGTLVPGKLSAGLHGIADEVETLQWDDATSWVHDPIAPRKRSHREADVTNQTPAGRSEGLRGVGMLLADTLTPPNAQYPPYLQPPPQPCLPHPSLATHLQLSQPSPLLVLAHGRLVPAHGYLLPAHGAALMPPMQQNVVTMPIAAPPDAMHSDRALGAGGGLSLAGSISTTTACSCSPPYSTSPASPASASQDCQESEPAPLFLAVVKSAASSSDTPPVVALPMADVESALLAPEAAPVEGFVGGDSRQPHFLPWCTAPSAPPSPPEGVRDATRHALSQRSKGSLTLRSMHLFALKKLDARAGARTILLCPVWLFICLCYVVTVLRGDAMPLALACAPLINSAANAILLPLAPFARVHPLLHTSRLFDLGISIISIGAATPLLYHILYADQECWWLGFALQGSIAAAMATWAALVTTRTTVSSAIDFTDFWCAYRAAMFIAGTGQVVSVLAQLAVLGASAEAHYPPGKQPLLPAAIWGLTLLLSTATCTPNVRKRCSDTFGLGELYTFGLNELPGLPEAAGPAPLATGLLADPATIYQAEAAAPAMDTCDASSDCSHSIGAQSGSASSGHRRARRVRRATRPALSQRSKGSLDRPRPSAGGTIVGSGALVVGPTDHMSKPSSGGVVGSDILDARAVSRITVLIPWWCAVFAAFAHTVYQDCSIMSDFITYVPFLNAAINAVLLPAAPSAEPTKKFRRYFAFAASIVPLGQAVAWLFTFSEDHPCRPLRAAIQGLMTAGVSVVAARVLCGIERDFWHCYRSVALILGAGQVASVLAQLTVLGASSDAGYAPLDQPWPKALALGCSNLLASALFSPNVRQRCSDACGMGELYTVRLAELEIKHPTENATEHPAEDGADSELLDTSVRQARSVPPATR